MNSPGPAGIRVSSISNKILAVLVAVAVLPAVTVSLYAMRRTTRALTDQTLNLMVDSALDDARRVQDQLADEHESLKALAGISHVRNLCANLAFLFQGAEEPKEAAERRMQELAIDLQWTAQKLQTFLEQHETTVSILLFTRRANRALPAMRVERRGNLVQASSAFALDPVTSQLHFSWDSVRRPLDDLFMERLWDVAKEHPVRSTHRVTVATPDEGAYEVFLANVETRDGVVVGHVVVVLSWWRLLRDLCALPAGDSAPQDLVQATLLGNGMGQIDSSDRDLPVTPPPEMVEKAMQGMAAATLTASGEIVSFAPLSHPLDEGNFSVLAFRRPTSEEFDRVARSRYVFLTVLAAALLLALAVGSFLARRLTRPLRVLRDGAKRIASGELDQTLEVATGDEVEDLASEFNHMAQELRSLYSGMEQTIQKRTQELQEALDELRAAHQKLVESEARYSDIVENATDLIQVTDRTGRILAANRRQAELFGVSTEDLRGYNFFDWVATDLREATREAFDSVLGGATITAFSSALQVGKDRRISLEISATPILRNGDCVGARAIMRDVSERKEVEAKLIKAERLSSVGALAAGVAHEINNPLGIITMFAQRVLEKSRNGELDVQKLETIVAQARRVAQITKGLLDFSRAAPTEFRHFSLREVIEETRALLEERARRLSIDIEVRAEEDLPPAYGNPQQIAQVLLNLLLNALHAIQQEGRIVVSAAMVAKSRLGPRRPALQVRVEDSGPGIPQDVLPHLFEPFFTTKGPGEGTGLGLSVSYGILKEHHGALFAENSPGGGACFTLELPVSPVSPASPKE